MTDDYWLSGGASRDRTDDPLLAKQVLSQLSYGPPDLSVFRYSALRSSLGRHIASTMLAPSLVTRLD